MPTLTTPAPGRPITAPFGWRVHPITGRRTFHQGIDYAGQFTVLLAGRARIIAIGYSARGYGNYVVAEHSRGLRTLYAHGAQRSQLIQNRTYADGMAIFKSGTTGASTGNHLHFEVRVRNRLGVWVTVNPTPYLQPAPKPSNLTLERRKRSWLL